MNEKDKIRREKKKYLGQVKIINLKIESDLRLIQKYISMSENVKTVNYCKKESIAANKVRARDFEHVEEKIEAESKLLKHKTKLKEKILEIKDVIEKVEDLEERLFLQYYYLECLDWIEIEKIMGVGKDYLYRLHTRALKSVQIPKTVKTSKNQ